MAASVTQLLNHFVAVRRRSLQICDSLEIEDYSPQPIAEVSPPKWHLGHTTWFFENFILSQYLDCYKPINEHYFYIFNSYYESFGQRLQRDSRSQLSRPTVKQVIEYREQVNTTLAELFSSQRLTGRDLDEAKTLLEIGIHHEQQHQELLLMDIKYILAQNVLPTQYFFEKVADSSTRKNPVLLNNRGEKRGYVPIPGGLVEIGHNDDSFSYDHERPCHKVYLENFNLRDSCVTNREYLEFIGDGGYRDFRFWHSDGWDWLRRDEIRFPLYWREVDGCLQEYQLGEGWQELNLDLPVSHVSFYEASAFANWSGLRLPTEQEWEHASNVLKNDFDPRNFFEESQFLPVKTKTSFQDMLGSLWEWTSSAFVAYPGYRIPQGALAEYNSKFMSNQIVLKGGCYATPLSHYRNSYRNFFFPNQRWQFSGIRLAKD